MCTVPPSGRRRVSERTTTSVRRATTSRTREEPALWLPSTARKALVIATEIFSGSKATTAALRRITWKATSEGSVPALRARTFEDKGTLRFGGRRIQRRWAVRGRVGIEIHPYPGTTRRIRKNSTCTHLSPGTPRPVVAKKVVAGLLALGSACTTGLPGPIQASSGKVGVVHSPMTVAGAAPAYRSEPGTGFPFNPHGSGNQQRLQYADETDVSSTKVLHIVDF
jgi:hypothetical protein